MRLNKLAPNITLITRSLLPSYKRVSFPGIEEDDDGGETEVEENEEEVCANGESLLRTLRPNL